MAIAAALYSSVGQDWETPADLFARLDAEFHFTLDLAAQPHTAKCPAYYTPADDALAQPWRGTCWLNPPYGKGLGAWLRKARESARDGATVVCLLPSRTDTAWWHDLVAPFAEVRFLRGRLRFSSGIAAPFPSIIAIYRPPEED